MRLQTIDLMNLNTNLISLFDIQNMLCESLILIQHYKYLVNLCIDKNNALKERNKRHTDIHLYVRINSCSYRRCGVVLYSQTPWTWSDCKSMFATYSLYVITVCSLRGISNAYFPF